MLKLKFQPNCPGVRNIRHQMDTGHTGEIFKVNTANWFWDPLTHFETIRKWRIEGFARKSILRVLQAKSGGVSGLKPKKMAIYKHRAWFALLGVGLPCTGAQFTPEEAKGDCGKAERVEAAFEK